ncbi:MAG: hypothetical protein R6U27_11390 [Desulfobacterales bacterium]
MVAKVCLVLIENRYSSPAFLLLLDERLLVKKKVNINNDFEFWVVFADSLNQPFAGIDFTILFIDAVTVFL